MYVLQLYMCILLLLRYMYAYKLTCKYVKVQFKEILIILFYQLFKISFFSQTYCTLSCANFGYIGQFNHHIKCLRWMPLVKIPKLIPNAVN